MTEGFAIGDVKPPGPAQLKVDGFALEVAVIVTAVVLQSSVPPVVVTLGAVVFPVTVTVLAAVQPFTAFVTVTL